MVEGLGKETTIPWMANLGMTTGGCYEKKGQDKSREKKNEEEEKREQGQGSNKKQDWQKVHKNSMGGFNRLQPSNQTPHRVQNSERKRSSRRQTNKSQFPWIKIRKKII